MTKIRRASAIELWRDTTSTELFGYAAAVAGVEATVESDDAPECRRWGSAGEGALVLAARIEVAIAAPQDWPA